jgi:uncharacterized protein YkwD
MPRRTLLIAFLILQAMRVQAGPKPSPIERQMLAAHNAVRGRLRLKPLEWSDDLESVARVWAEVLLREHRFEHRPNNRFGENLFAIEGGRTTPSRVVASWASEVFDYDYESNGCHRVCGHYTQIVWRDTRQVGCAVAQSANRQVWVCNYNPPGNIVGRRPY